MRAAGGPSLAAAAVLVALAAAGCSLDYREMEAGEALAESIPDTVLHGVTHKVVKESRLAVSFEAETVENYTKRKQTILEAVRFTEYGSGGDVLTEGRAASVVYHTDTEDAEMNGSVSVRSYKEKATVTAGSLSWVKDKRLLNGDPGETVTLEKEDGSYVSGLGFLGDFRNLTVRFQGPVTGMYVYKDEEEGE